MLFAVFIVIVVTFVVVLVGCCYNISFEIGKKMAAWHVLFSMFVLDTFFFAILDKVQKFDERVKNDLNSDTNVFLKKKIKHSFRSNLYNETIPR